MVTRQFLRIHSPTLDPADVDASAWRHTRGSVSSDINDDDLRHAVKQVMQHRSIIAILANKAKQNCSQEDACVIVRHALASTPSASACRQELGWKFTPMELESVHTKLRTCFDSITLNKTSASRKDQLKQKRAETKEAIYKNPLITRKRYIVKMNKIGLSVKLKPTPGQMLFEPYLNDEGKQCQRVMKRGESETEENFNHRRQVIHLIGAKIIRRRKNPQNYDIRVAADDLASSSDDEEEEEDDEGETDVEPKNRK